VDDGNTTAVQPEVTWDFWTWLPGALLEFEFSHRNSGGIDRTIEDAQVNHYRQP
jgi:hypothetical protein